MEFCKNTIFYGRVVLPFIYFDPFLIKNDKLRVNIHKIKIQN